MRVNIVLSAALLLVMTTGLGARQNMVPAWPKVPAAPVLPYDAAHKPPLIPYDIFMAEPKESGLPSAASTALTFPYMDSLKQDSNYSLVAAQSPVKNQGSRGQCHNFTTTAAMEYAVWAGEGKAQDFSEQCNAWKFYRECPGCLNNPDSADDSGYADQEVFFVYNKFMKYESDFPYSDTDRAFCSNEYNQAPVHELKGVKIYRQTPNQIKAAIDRSYVVVFETAWKNQGWNAQGEYPYADTYSACNAAECGGHAVVIVGYDDNYYGTGQGGYLFKNSWAPQWSEEKGAKPAGYGVLPYPYVNQFARRLVAVSHEKVAGGDLNPAPAGCAKKRR